MLDQDSDGEKIYLMLYASQKPQSVTFLECRERARIIDVGAVALDDVDDVPDAHREFDVLDPLVIVPDHKVPLAEDTNIGREATEAINLYRNQNVCSVFGVSISGSLR